MVANESEPIPDSIRWHPERELGGTYGEHASALPADELARARLHIIRPSADHLEESERPRLRRLQPPNLAP